MKTVKQLLEELNSYPKNLKVQLDLDGARYFDFNIDKAEKDTLVIFSDGEPEF